MQRHFHRTEIWLFLSECGFAEKIWKIQPTQWHTFCALDKPVYAIELQYGKKVTETDIERI